MQSLSSPPGFSRLFLVAVALTSPGFLRAASIRITSPSPKAVVSGIYNFAVDVSAVPAVDRVEYRLGSLSLGFAASPPFSLAWNSGYASDGNYALDATAYDAKGEPIATTEQVFAIQNRGASITFDEQQLSAPLRGRVKLWVTGTDPRYYPARWDVFVDGNMHTIFYSDNTGKNSVTADLPIDTTRFSNGKHELHVEIASDFWPAGDHEKKTFYDNRLALHRVIAIDNGHLLKRIAPGFENVYLKPGASAVLGCLEFYTDERSSQCPSATYVSANPSVVSVDGSGKLTAQKIDGFSTIAITSGDKKTEAFVWVRKNLNIPHFSGNGRILNSYQPGESLFPVAPFFLGVGDVQDPDIDREAKRAGVNTLYRGFYSNPRNLQASLSHWEANYDANVGKQWTWAASHGYHLYVMGDEITRGVGGEAWWTLNWPPAKAAVQHAMESLASSGVAIAADIIDEGSMLWGGNPTPPRLVGEPGMFTSIACEGARCAVAWPANPVNPRRFYAGVQFALTGSRQANLNTPAGQMFTATNITDHSFDFAPAGALQGTFTKANDPNLEFLWWAGPAGGCPSSPCNPPVPNTALLTIAGWLRTANPHVLISWPALGLASPATHGVWAGKDSKVSDFMSHYWDSLQAGHTYRWSNGVAERNYWMREAFYRRQPFVDASRPQVILDSISGFYYRKLVAGSSFNPLGDQLIAAGTSPAAIACGMMTAAAMGNAGVRLYQFEGKRAEDGRSRIPIGGETQSGAGPISGQSDLRAMWRAIGYAANLLTKRLDPFILGTAISAPPMGDNIVTALRESDHGKMLMAVNGNDWDKTLAVNLAPYRQAAPVTRYVLEGAGIRTELIPDASTNTVTLRPGGTVVYLMPAAASEKFLSTTAVAAPALPSGASKAYLHQAYIYSEDLDTSTQGLDCTNGCNLALDRNLGNSYYQLSFTNAAGVGVGKGPIRMLTGLR